MEDFYCSIVRFFYGGPENLYRGPYNEIIVPHVFNLHVYY